MSVAFSRITVLLSYGLTYIDLKLLNLLNQLSLLVSLQIDCLDTSSFKIL